MKKIKINFVIFGITIFLILFLIISLGFMKYYDQQQGLNTKIEINLAQCRSVEEEWDKYVNIISESHMIYLSSEDDDNLKRVYLNDKRSITPELLVEEINGRNTIGLPGITRDGKKFGLNTSDGVRIYSFGDDGFTLTPNHVAVDEFTPYSDYWNYLAGINNGIGSGVWYSPPDGKLAIEWNKDSMSLNLVRNDNNTSQMLKSFTNISGVYGSWSPSGSKFVITINGFSNEESFVYLFDKQTGEIVALAKFSDELLLQPFWSNDEKKIVFAIGSIPYAFEVLETANHEGTGSRFDFPTGYSSIANDRIQFSPDNKWLLFIDHDRRTSDLDGKISGNLKILNIFTGEILCVTNRQKEINVVYFDWK